MQCYKLPGVKVVTRWGEGADVVKILCSLCLFNCKQVAYSDRNIVVLPVYVLNLRQAMAQLVCVHCILSAIS